MTILGLPLVPFAVLAILVLWTLAYLLAAYVLSLRLLSALGGPAEPATRGRVGALVVGVVVVALLNFIPFLGWMINLTLVLWGLGGMVLMLAARFVAPVQAPLMPA